jgi:Concanavalin A-like lectin/glucanases superfamily
MLYWILLCVQALDCDVSVDTGICIYSESNVIKPLGVPDSLTGYWSFDDNQGLDYSGLGNNANTAASPGMSFNGRGSSAKFLGNDYISVPSTVSISSKVFSLTFWVYMFIEDTINRTGLRYCPILQKGNDDETTETYERTPAIFFDRQTTMLKIYVTTTQSQDFPEGEYLESYAHIPYERWTHITVIRTTQRITLYVNGIFDQQNNTYGWTDPNSSPLYIGGSPSKGTECPMPFLIDELRYYTREVTTSEIFSESTGSLGQMESRFMTLGCVKCTLDTASASCSDGYHLCTTIELHSGGYDIVRAMGWYQISAEVWSYNALGTDYDTNELGLGVCCIDLGY